MKKALIHPFLITLYPILLLYSINIDRTPVDRIYRIAGLATAGAILVLLFFRLLTRSWFRASLITSLWIVLFSSYGHVYNLLNGRSLFGVPIGQANVLAAMWASLLIIMTWFIWRKLGSPVPIHEIMNIFSIFLVLMPIIQIANFSVNSAIFNGWKTKEQATPVLKPTKNGQRYPDIYYIVLDEYGRADMLDQVLGFDNSAFIQGLEKRGFYLAKESYSNYGITLQSLSSSLNFNYINEDVSKNENDVLENTRYLMELISQNKASNILRQHGYQFITFATGYPFSEIHTSDLYIEPKNYINGFEFEYLKGTVLAILSDPITAARERSLILNSFEQIATLPGVMPGSPKFVFAHIQSNHVPFVFGPNGEPVQPWAWSSVPGQLPQGKTYAQAYRDQTVYMNKLILDTVDSLLSQSSPMPVIILQADHGTEQELDWYSVEKSCVKERMAILSAYFFPDGDYSALYPSVTPVNTFRILFDKYFGMNFGLVDDRVYFSLWDQSYDFLDVTEAMVDCRP